MIKQKVPKKDIQAEAAKIFGDEDIQKNQAKDAAKGREAKYITSGDPIWAKLYGKTLTFQKDQGELKKLYNELTEAGRKEAIASVKPQGEGLLNNIQLKF